jgi:hypothetical protein
VADTTAYHKLKLGYGLELRCTMDSLDDSVLVAIAWHSIVPWKGRFSRRDDHKTVRLALPFLRIELGLWTNVFSGEIEGKGYIAVRPFAGKWLPVLDIPRRLLVRFDPAVGEIGGTVEFVEPVVDDPTYGRSQLCTPAILRLHVDAGERAISDAGRLVKEKLFKDRGPFVFNTVACVGPLDDDGRGAYPNPNSIWFNVFFGCYQIDAPKSGWDRPFGYVSADEAESKICFDDVTRLGEADWNFFSNWMYGVPLEKIEPYGAIDPVDTHQEPAPVPIGNTLWHTATIEKAICVSTYESDAPGAARLVRNSVIDEVWRRAFGLPNPQEGNSDSFVPTTLRARLHMAYSEDDDAYHTMICGGTAVVTAKAEFLATQMTAVETVIETGYPDAGFPSA